MAVVLGLVCARSTVLCWAPSMSNSPPSAPNAHKPVPAGVTSMMCAFNVSVSKSLVVAVVISGAIAISPKWAQASARVVCGLLFKHEIYVCFHHRDWSAWC